jgi:crossover junction endodeoxyribonuclease RuvC
MIILGIDPGYDRCGWGVIEKKVGNYSYIACGLIQTPKTDEHIGRISKVSKEIWTILQTYKPQVVSIETLFFSKNVTSALKVAEVRGAILSTVGNWSEDVKFQEYNPMQIKSAVTGVGNADKKAVEKMVRLQLKGVPEKLIDDTVDALAIALTSGTKTY